VIEIKSRGMVATTFRESEFFIPDMCYPEPEPEPPVVEKRATFLVFGSTLFYTLFYILY
jgi:hypothetical protein